MMRAHCGRGRRQPSTFDGWHWKTLVTSATLPTLFRLVASLHDGLDRVLPRNTRPKPGLETRSRRKSRMVKHKGSDGGSSPHSGVELAYETAAGRMFEGKIEDALVSEPFASIRGKINLIVTSPPFPLVRKKRYGNTNGEAYLRWLESLACPLADLLTDDGSIVIEIGNAWEQGAPIMSTLPLEALLAFKRSANLNLCQHIICHNPARLPSPAAWVNL